MCGWRRGDKRAICIDNISTAPIFGGCVIQLVGEPDVVQVKIFGRSARLKVA